MNHIDEALKEIMYQRTKIREDFVKAYLAFNVKDVTPEVFNTLIIVETTVKPGVVTFEIKPRAEFERGE